MFVKGQSGNKNGKSKKQVADRAEFLGKLVKCGHVDTALGVVAMRLQLNDEKVAIWVLEMSYGKPTQSNELSGKDGEPMQVSTFSIPERS